MITDEFLRSLPDGVIYHDPESEKKQDEAKLGSGSEDNDQDADIVRCGNFSFNIEMVTKPQIISLRKYLPPEEYRLLKNRKTARLCRRKRKKERSETAQSLEKLQKAN